MSLFIRTPGLVFSCYKMTQHDNPLLSSSVKGCKKVWKSGGASSNVVGIMPSPRLRWGNWSVKLWGSWPLGPLAPTALSFINISHMPELRAGNGGKIRLMHLIQKLPKCIRNQWIIHDITEPSSLRGCTVSKNIVKITNEYVLLLKEQMAIKIEHSKLY